jgi:hypothetical protein
MRLDYRQASTSKKSISLECRRQYSNFDVEESCNLAGGRLHTRYTPLVYLIVLKR